MKRTITTLTTSGYAIIMFVGALLLLGALYVVNYKYAPASTMITSNRIMSCMDERGMLSFIINYHPQDLVRKNWFDEQNPLVLSSQDNNSKNYVIKYSAAYDVSTDRGNRPVSYIWI